MTGEANPTPPAADGGCEPAGAASSSCAVKCPAAITIEAACRVVRADGGSIQLTAQNAPGFGGGSFAWTSSSANVTLVNANSATVTVVGGAGCSASEDAESIEVTRTEHGCPSLTASVTVTVARVRFSKAAGQRYGHDDFDTPADTTDDHVGVKKSDHTFVQVDIEGGLVGTDFDFACDDAATCAPAAAPGSASFELRLNAGAHNKRNTNLQAKCKCPGAESFARLAIHVYKEKSVEVVVAKIYDSTQAGTNLHFPNADYAAHTATVNGKLKTAVVKFSITNFAAAAGKTDVRYDLDGNGALSYDIASGGGAGLDAIKAAMTGTGTKTRVAIVRAMKSYYYLSAAAAIGDTTVTVTAGSVFNYPAGRQMPLGSGASSENVVVASSSGSTVTLGTPLTKAHAVGEALEFPAAGWSSDPILIIEGSTTLDVIKWTIPHEVGHRALELRDVDDATNFMHWMQSWTDHRLRYCPRTKKHEAGTENQWEKIPR